ncbi:MAG TPA: branched-chain amino acid ABC transporter permease [Candidatus Sulfotelmatobacter sp.]|nr:branched-chain amino acid ABC transporter permease [Candidatus Sulfotelmatobacter sp.]
MSRAAGPALGGAALLGVAAAPWLLSSYSVGLLTQALIYAIFAMSLDLLLGYTGLPSLGHAAYFGVAAYTLGLLALRAGLSFWAALPWALAAAAGVGALFALLAVRARGAYFLMITLALGQVLWGTAFRWRSLTGGEDGISGLPRPALRAWAPPAGPAGYHLFVLAVFLVAALALAILVRSPFGLALKGIRASESRMEALGYNVWLYKYLAFVLAAALAGLAGTLFGAYTGFVSPADLSIVTSARALLMVILGGAGTLAGPAVGAGAILLLESWVSTQLERWLSVLGAVYILVVVFCPHGLVRLFRPARGGRAAA